MVVPRRSRTLPKMPVRGDMVMVGPVDIAGVGAGAGSWASVGSTENPSTVTTAHKDIHFLMMQLLLKEPSGKTAHPAAPTGLPKCASHVSVFLCKPARGGTLRRRFYSRGPELAALLRV